MPITQVGWKALTDQLNKRIAELERNETILTAHLDKYRQITDRNDKRIAELEAAFATEQMSALKEET